MFIDSVTRSTNSSWVLNLKLLLDNLGYSFLWNDMSITKSQLKSVIERLYSQYYQSFMLWRIQCQN